MLGNFKLTARRSYISLLFLGMLVESIYAPRGSSPGRSGAFILAWAIGARQFQATPTNKLLAFCSFCAFGCLALNHYASGIDHSSMWRNLCLVSGIVIVWWDRSRVASESEE